MKESLKSGLSAYHKHLKEEKEKGAELTHVSKEERALALETGRKRGTNGAIEVGLLNLQKKKLEIMVNLKRRLKEIHAPQEDINALREEREHPVSRIDGNYFVSNHGTVRPITLGDIMTGADWGITFRLNASTPQTIRRHYELERAKSLVRDIADLQILTDEANNALSPRDVILKYKKRLQERLHNRERSGIHAEKLVKTFLKKMSWDADLDFSIEDASVDEDIQHATDFYVRIKRPEYKRIRVQFTTQTTEHVREVKEKRIARLEEPVVIVQGRFDTTPKRFMLQWLAFKDPVKGPEQLMTWENKLRLARAVLEKVMPAEQCEGNMAKIERALKSEEGQS